jgi:hypothetical protein
MFGACSKARGGDLWMATAPKVGCRATWLTMGARSLPVKKPQETEGHKHQIMLEEVHSGHKSFLAKAAALPCA